MGWFETSHMTSDSAVSRAYMLHVLIPKLHGSPDSKGQTRNASLRTVCVIWILCFVLSRDFLVLFCAHPHTILYQKNKRALEKAQGNQPRGHVWCALFPFFNAPGAFFVRRFYPAQGLWFLCLPPPVAFVLASCSSQMPKLWIALKGGWNSWKVEINIVLITFWDLDINPSFATQQVPRFQGSSVAVQFRFWGFGKKRRATLRPRNWNPTVTAVVNHC